MPKKIRTLDAELKSLLTKKHKPNPMQKIKGMPKEHIIQTHDELLKKLREDLDRLGQKKFFDEVRTEKSIIGTITVHGTSSQFHSEVDVISLDASFLKAPVGVVASKDPTLDPDWESKVEFMRADLACGMGYSRIIETVRKRMKEDGLDFDEEFKKWKEEKDAIKMHRI